MADSYVYILPTYFNRTDLVPLPGTPWLVLPAPKGRHLPVLGGALVLTMAFGHSGDRWFWGWFLLTALCAGIHAALCADRRTFQVCPACLRAMARTATRCPSCHFSDVRTEALCVE